MLHEKKEAKRKELKLTELTDYWWAIRPSRQTDCRWQRSGSCPEKPCWRQNKGQGSLVCVRVHVCVCVHVCMCVCAKSREGHISLHLQVPPHTHRSTRTGHQLHLSLTWESLMTEAEKPKKRPPRPPSLAPSLHFPSIRLLTAHSNINAPYGALWTHFKTGLGLAHNQ